jgi:hypothetical protein
MSIAPKCLAGALARGSDVGHETILEITTWLFAGKALNNKSFSPCKTNSSVGGGEPS